MMRKFDRKLILSDGSEYCGFGFGSIPPVRRYLEYPIQNHLLPFHNCQSKGMPSLQSDKYTMDQKGFPDILREKYDAGAKEIHMRISAPPFLNPCYYGTDIDSEENLIACHHSVDEIACMIGADSLGYLPIEKLNKLIDSEDYCAACFQGKYNFR